MVRTAPQHRAALAAEDKVGVWTSLFTVALSIPALVGSCCWPLLLASFAGIAASEASKRLAHSVSFGVTLAVLTNIAQMVRWKSKTRGGNRWNKRGPLLLTLASVPLVMLDLTRHVLQDGGAWIEGSRMYRPGCGHADVRCLSGIGATCLLATYVGFACLISGVLWSADVPRKLRDGWRRAARRDVD